METKTFTVTYRAENGNLECITVRAGTVTTTLNKVAHIGYWRITNIAANFEIV